jgi:hypothetical protein
MNSKYDDDDDRHYYHIIYYVLQRTPIITAALRGKVDVFKTLLRFGADLSSVCASGFSVLDAALLNDQLNICTEIIKHERYALLADVKIPIELKFHLSTWCT